MGADMNDSLKLDPSIWCCPFCQNKLQVKAGGWECPECKAAHFITNGILHIQSSESVPRLANLPEWLNSVSQHVREKGWEEGLRSIYPRLSNLSYAELISIRNPKRYAWQLVMESGAWDRVLCLDTTLGSASIELAKRFGEVYCLMRGVDEGLCVNRRLMEHNKVGIHPFVCDTIPRLPFRGAIFDAVVVTSLEQFVPSSIPGRQAEDWIGRLVEEVRRVLKPGGRFGLVGRNRFGYDRVRAQLEFRNQFKERPAVSLPTIRQALSRSKFSGQEMFSMLPDPYECREIVPAGKSGFKSSYIGPWDRLMRRIKSSRQFSPGFFLSASENLAGKSILDSLMEECHSRLGKRLGWKSVPRMDRLLVTNPNAVILMAGGKTPEERMVVIRIPLDEVSVTRCQANRQALIETRKLGGWMSSKVPEFFAEGQVQGQPYFVEECLQGRIIVDWDVQVPRHTEKSVEALLELHCRTAVKTKIDESVFEASVVPGIDRLKPLLTVQQMELLQPIADYLKKNFMGREIPLVRTHGDYKIENIIFNEKGTEFIGVIDWDLSRAQGLPGLDLIHLLTYNRILRDQTHYGAVVSEILFRSHWDPTEISQVKHYMEQMEIEDFLCLPLCLAYWLDHVAYRSIPELIMFYPDWAAYDFDQVARSALDNVVNKR